MLDVNLKAPEHYINRELSFLDFNYRVLAQAHDEALPLLERIRFLGISCSNLDEFFEIRVAGLKQRLELGSLGGGPDGMSVPEQLTAIHERAMAIVKDQYDLLHQLVFPALAARGVQFANGKTLTARQRTWLADYFAKEVEPVLTPLGLDPARPFPRIQNKSQNFIVRLSGKDAFGRDAELAVVQVPRSLPRIIRLPQTDEAPGTIHFVFLSAVISTFIARLFNGMTVEGAWQFRVTRNSDLFVDDEEVDNLLRAIEGELAQRRYGAAVRLETSVDCPEDITNFLLRHFALTKDDLYQVNGPLNLNRLMAIYDLLDRPDLKYMPFTPCIPKRVVAKEDIFAVMRDADLLLHHPFESFAPVIDLLRQAGTDPDVLAIKQTLYRTSNDSPIVTALCEAADAGKSVTALVELKARFDEAANIRQSRRLERSGAHVVYGFTNYKTHAKISTVVRREGDNLVTYTHYGTGNYHPITARIYTDLSLFTCDPALGRDATKVFNYLSGYVQPEGLENLAISPITLKPRLLEMIAAEADHARAGRPAAIWAKLNSVIEPDIIDALYAASQAGVKIQLVIRGICGLRPGIAGLSENIRVKSIVGRFLEHSRIICFGNGHGLPSRKARVFISSADWMGRNLTRRVETLVEIRNDTVKAQIVSQIMAANLADEAQSWVLQPDGRYLRDLPEGRDDLFNCHRFFMENPSLSGRGSAGAKDVPKLAHTLD